MNPINSKVSVMIATFNSAKTLPLVLEALRKQNYPQDQLEIICIDGGSSDNTRSIAGKYNCIVLDNPKTNPVEAKLIGINYASGKYLLTIDHDEVLENRNSIYNRICALEENSDIKVAFCSGYKRPDDYPALNQYISEFGDPFSLFVYHFSKDYHFFYKTLKKYYKEKKKTKTYSIISFKNAKHPIICELVCMGTIINLDYFQDKFDLSKGDELTHLFYQMLNDNVFDVVISKNDPLTHYSADSFKAYLPKIKWRIINNVHFPQKAKQGFDGRLAFSPRIKKKKYLFILYTIFLPVVIGHSVFLAISRKNAVYLCHVFLCWYTMIMIFIHMALHIIGYTPKLKSYDGKKVVNRE